jgi:hypothetical protein
MEEKGTINSTAWGGDKYGSLKGELVGVSVYEPER